MLKNILKKSGSDEKTKAGVLADLRRTLKVGDRVGFMHQGKLLGGAVVLAIEDNRLLYEPLESIGGFKTASIVSNLEQGIPWNFSVKALKVIKEGSDTYLQSVIPSRVNLNSRRNNFRVPTPYNLKAELHFVIDGHRCVASILDLSRTGAQISFNNRPNSSFGVDKVVKNSKLKLGWDDPLVVDFQPCWTSDSEKVLRAGIKFIDIPNADSDRIHQQVGEIERALIRKLKGLD
jgi:c-di-GMP-binding flagellar brake protein YcgR